MEEKAKISKTYDIVTKYIKDKIIDGTLKIGDRLPSEREMAEKLGVSRTSIREAIRALEVIGIIESRRGAGTYIVDNFNNSLFQPLSMMFMLQEYSALDILELREGLEIQCCKMASKVISKKDIEVLNNIVSDMYETTNEDKSLDLDIKFHNVIIKASNNPLIINVLSVISQLMDKFIKDARKIILCKNDNREKLLDTHKDIVLAIESRDESKCVYSIKKHFELIKESYIAIS